NSFFLIIHSGGSESFKPIEIQGLLQSYFDRFNQLFARFFLAVHSWDFFHPTDPPVAILLYQRGVYIFHVDLSKTTSGIETRFLRRPLARQAKTHWGTAAADSTPAPHVRQRY